jgi:predicted ATP-dependent protease
MEVTGDREKLTLKLADISDLLKEADYYAGVAKSKHIKSEHVQRAIDKKRFRASLYEEKVQELVKKDIFWIETDGHKVGQVNGLSILMTGDHEFGKPSRITATVSMGKSGVVDIDREAKLSGNIHTKGVMILHAYIKEKFAHNKPLSLSASLCFEQSYGMSLQHRTLRAALCYLRSANLPGHCCYRLSEPEGRNPAHWRGDPQNRGLLRYL